MLVGSNHSILHIGLVKFIYQLSLVLATFDRARWTDFMFECKGLTPVLSVLLGNPFASSTCPSITSHFRVGEIKIESSLGRVDVYI